MRGNDVHFQDGTRPNTPSTNFVPAERDGHPVDLQKHVVHDSPVSTFSGPSAVLRTHMAECIDPSDVARLRSQVSLCENEIFTLRERLRVANAACSSKDQVITQLQMRIDKDVEHLGGTREWCGGPCRGTRPLRDGKRERKRNQSRRTPGRTPDEPAAVAPTEDIVEEPAADPQQTSQDWFSSRRSSHAANELEAMLDLEIARHRDSDMPQMLAEWDLESGAADHPNSPHHALPWELSGDKFEGGDGGDDAMAQLDREIEAAHHEEELLLRHEETIRKMLPKK